MAESDPDDEVDETTTKFRTILTGLGVDAMSNTSDGRHPETKPRSPR